MSHFRHWLIIIVFIVVHVFAKSTDEGSSVSEQRTQSSYAAKTSCAIEFSTPYEAYSAPDFAYQFVRFEEDKRLRSLNSEIQNTKKNKNSAFDYLTIGPYVPSKWEQRFEPAYFPREISHLQKKADIARKTLNLESQKWINYIYDNSLAVFLENNKIDTLILGSGPTALNAAYLAAKKKRKVLVISQDSFPGSHFLNVADGFFINSPSFSERKNIFFKDRIDTNVIGDNYYKLEDFGPDRFHKAGDLADLISLQSKRLADKYGVLFLFDTVVYELDAGQEARPSVLSLAMNRRLTLPDGIWSSAKHTNEIFVRTELNWINDKKLIFEAPGLGQLNASLKNGVPNPNLELANHVNENALTNNDSLKALYSPPLIEDSQHFLRRRQLLIDELERLRRDKPRFYIESLLEIQSALVSAYDGKKVILLGAGGDSSYIVQEIFTGQAPGFQYGNNVAGNVAQKNSVYEQAAIMAFDKLVLVGAKFDDSRSIFDAKQKQLKRRYKESLPNIILRDDVQVHTQKAVDIKIRQDKDGNNIGVIVVLADGTKIKADHLIVSLGFRPTKEQIEKRAEFEAVYRKLRISQKFDFGFGNKEIERYETIEVAKAKAKNHFLIGPADTIHSDFITDHNITKNDHSIETSLEKLKLLFRDLP